MARTNRRRNVHHLLWEGRMHNGIRKIARELPCLKVSLDAEVHAILHKLYRVPNLISEDDAAYLVQRHKDKLCGCYDRSGNLDTSILFINGEQDDE